MKYVAFLDILGFKKKLSKLGQDRAKRYISNFSSTVYTVFQETDRNLVEGFIVSDCIVLNTKNSSELSLREIIKTIIRICRNEFIENSILMRGAIAKGNFENMPAVELANLRKELIVGQAYVDAYLLEDKAKISGIILTQEVYDDLSNINLDVDYMSLGKSDDTFLMRYMTLDFLLLNNHISRFIVLAQESKWLPHYYNTLYLSLVNEKNDKKVDQLFENILSIISKNQPSENWREIDLFIQNAFSNDVDSNFQKRFLRYIRGKLYPSYTYRR